MRVAIGSAVHIPLGIDSLHGNEMRRGLGKTTGALGRDNPVMLEYNDGIPHALQVMAPLHLVGPRSRVGRS